MRVVAVLDGDGPALRERVVHLLRDLLVGSVPAALAGAAWVRGRVARTLPHAVDTVLLASAIGLAWLLQLNPLTTPWLAAKIAGKLDLSLGEVTLKTFSDGEIYGRYEDSIRGADVFLVQLAVASRPVAEPR